MTVATNSNKPVCRAQLDVVSAALFESRDEENGSSRRNVSLQKRYYDSKAQEWKSSTCYLSPSQLSAAIRVLQQVESYLLNDQSLTEEPSF